MSMSNEKKIYLRGKKVDYYMFELKICLDGGWKKFTTQSLKSKALATYKTLKSGLI